MRASRDTIQAHIRIERNTTMTSSTDQTTSRGGELSGDGGQPQYDDLASHLRDILDYLHHETEDERAEFLDDPRSFAARRTDTEIEMQIESGVPETRDAAIDRLRWVLESIVDGRADAFLKEFAAELAGECGEGR